MGKNRKRRALTDVQGVSAGAGGAAKTAAAAASGGRDETGAAARKRRRRTAKRAADAAAAEAEVQRAAGQGLTARADEALFMVDTRGSAGAASIGKRGKGKKKQAKAKKAGAGSGGGAGAAASKAGAAALATVTRAKRTRPSRRDTTVAKQKLELFDAWAGGGAVAVPAQKKVTRPRRMTTYKAKPRRALQVDHEHPAMVMDAVPVPHAGTSVNPAREHHQDALAEVLAAELAAKQDDFVPIATAADDEDGSGDDDDAGSSDGSDASGDEESGWVGVARRRKDGEKYTRAKRNKIARTKAARRAAADAKREAKMRADLARAGELKKALAEKKAAKAAEKALKKLARAERLANPKLVEGGKLVDVRPTLDVPLSDELAESKGRLRSSKVLPAQVLMKEHFTRYKQRRLFETGAKRSQRKGKTKIVGEGEYK